MKLIIGNLKMNLTYYELKKYVAFFREKDYSNVFFAPSDIYLGKFIEAGLYAVAQDVSPYEIGAYTGDVSAIQLKSLGIDYAIVGHSERRKYYGDSLLVNQKVIRLLEQRMKPILCIGESKEERENNSYLDVIKKELDEAFINVKSEFIQEVIIAYEPVWSIGTGLVPNNDEIKEVITFIKKHVKEKHDVNVKVLYGGSVNNKCIEELEKIKEIDGYLVGGCSLKTEDFEKLINCIK